MLNQHSTHSGQTAQFSNTIIILSTGEFARVPAGDDPDTYRRWRELLIQAANNPKPKKQPKRTQRRSSRRNHRADGVLSLPFDSGMRATARRMEELALEDEDIFTGGIEWDIPFMGEPVPYESKADDYAVQQGW